MTLQTERLRTMEQVRAFVEGSEPVDYQPKDRASAYAFVRRTLVAFDYDRLGRADRGYVPASRTYRTKRTRWEKTRPSPVAIAVRKAPEPTGRPGFVRVDTVHLGDKDGRKACPRMPLSGGVYIVNMVDEVTHYEHVGAVPGISEWFMVPVLEALLLRFPFHVLGFHADNASRRDAPAPSTSIIASPPPADSLPGQAC